MAVTNNANIVETHETAPAYTSVGGGQGAGSETNFYFRGVTASSRKMSGVTLSGFWFAPSTGPFDMSAAKTHLKVFINAITQASFSDFELRIGSTTSAYEAHAAGVDFYDNDSGGWLPIWVEVDAGTDSGSPNFAAVAEICVLCSMGSISGNIKNWVTDQAHYATRPVMLWDGLTGDLDDFITTEITAGVGMLQLKNGLYTCYANFKIGSATSTSFDASGKTIAFPDATWLPAASDWMGIDFDLAHASTVLDWTGGAVISGNPTGASARKPDIIVTGTSGSVDFSGRTFDGIRIMSLTSGVLMNNASISNSGQIDAGSGADMAGTSILNSSVLADEFALLWDVNVDPNGELDNMKFTKGGLAHHAIGFGTNALLTQTLTGCDFSGFNAADGQNDSALHFADRGSDVTWTVNLSGCTGNLKYKKARAGDTIVLVIDPKSFAFTVDPSITGYEWRLYTVTAVGSMAGAVEVDGEESAIADNQSYAYTYSSDQAVAVQIISQPDEDYEEIIKYFTLVNSDQDVTIELNPDNNN